jgi:hypothetical protein
MQQLCKTYQTSGFNSPPFGSSFNSSILTSNRAKKLCIHAEQQKVHSISLGWSLDVFLQQKGTEPNAKVRLPYVKVHQNIPPVTKPKHRILDRGFSWQCS